MAVRKIQICLDIDQLFQVLDEEQQAINLQFMDAVSVLLVGFTGGVVKVFENTNGKISCISRFQVILALEDGLHMTIRRF